MIPTDESDADDEHDEPDPAPARPLGVLRQPLRLDAESLRVSVRQLVRLGQRRDVLLDDFVRRQRLFLERPRQLQHLLCGLLLHLVLRAHQALEVGRRGGAGVFADEGRYVATTKVCGEDTVLNSSETKRYEGRQKLVVSQLRICAPESFDPSNISLSEMFLRSLSRR